MRGFAAALLLVATSGWGQDSCNQDAPQQVQNKCAIQAADVAEAALSDAYLRAGKNLRADRRRALQESQRSWVEYRNSQCSLEGGEFKRGTLEPQVRALCRERMAKERTIILNELYQQSIDQ